MSSIDRALHCTSSPFHQFIHDPSKTSTLHQGQVHSRSQLSLGFHLSIWTWWSNFSLEVNLRIFIGTVGCYLLLRRIQKVQFELGLCIRRLSSDTSSILTFFIWTIGPRENDNWYSRWLWNRCWWQKLWPNFQESMIFGQTHRSILQMGRIMVMVISVSVEWLYFCFLTSKSYALTHGLLIAMTHNLHAVWLKFWGVMIFVNIWNYRNSRYTKVRKMLNRGKLLKSQ